MEMNTMFRVLRSQGLEHDSHEAGVEGEDEILQDSKVAALQHAVHHALVLNEERLKETAIDTHCKQNAHRDKKTDGKKE